jgi:hypothetical protein
MWQCNHFQGDIYFLRCLLNVVKSPRSFNDLYTVDGHLYHTFEEACKARGLISDRNKWEYCFDEAKEWRAGWHLHRLLIAAILHDGLQDASQIWHQFADYICDDLTYRIREDRLAYDPAIERPDLDYGLYLIDEALQIENKTLKSCRLPLYQNNWGRGVGNALIQQELAYNRDVLRQSADQRKLLLNDEQRAIYDLIRVQLEEDPPTRTSLYMAQEGQARPLSTIPSVIDYVLKGRLSSVSPQAALLLSFCQVAALLTNVSGSHCK